MNLEHRERLRLHMCDLVGDLLIDHMFLTLLIRDNILTLDHAEEIQSSRTSTEKAFALMVILPKRGPAAFPTLIEALVKTGQRHLAEILDPDLTRSWDGQGAGPAPNLVRSDSTHMEEVNSEKMLGVSRLAARFRRSTLNLVTKAEEADCASPPTSPVMTPCSSEGREEDFSFHTPTSGATHTVDVLHRSVTLSHSITNGSSIQADLIHHVHSGNCVAVKAAVTEGASVNGVDEQGHSALYIACVTGDLVTVEILVEHGANLKFARPVDGDTPLHAAARGKHGKMVDYLLRKGASLTNTDAEGLTVLHVAAYAGADLICKLLLRKGAMVNACTQSRLSVLQAAVEGGHLNTVNLLIEYGAHINSVDNEGWSPAHVAACGGNEEVLSVLLNRGAIVQAFTKSKNTMLHLAAQCGSHACVRLLINHYANVNAKDRNKFRPVHFAVHGGHMMVVKTLLRNGAKLQASNTAAPISALNIAAINGYLGIFQELLNHRANCTYRTKSGVSVLHSAAYGGNVDIAKLSIDAGCHINAQTDDDWSVLHAAARGCHKDMVSFLINRGAEVNARTTSGQSVLQAAVRGGDVATTTVLLEAGASFNAHDVIWWPILRELMQIGNNSLMKLLLDIGTDRAMDMKGGNFGSMKRKKKTLSVKRS